MKQLQLSNGDLVLGPGGFGMVSGAKKVAQDLGVAVREPIGCDRFHPGWGTILSDFIGQNQDSETQMMIRGEVSRVLQNYIVMQADQIIRDMDAGARSRFAAEEIVTSVRSIETQQKDDKIAVRVIVNTSSGGTVSVVRNVEME